MPDAVRHRTPQVVGVGKRPAASALGFVPQAVALVLARLVRRKSGCLMGVADLLLLSVDQGQMGLQCEFDTVQI